MNRLRHGIPTEATGELGGYLHRFLGAAAEVCRVGLGKADGLVLVARPGDGGSDAVRLALQPLKPPSVFYTPVDRLHAAALRGSRRMFPGAIFVLEDVPPAVDPEVLGGVAQDLLGRSTGRRRTGGAVLITPTVPVGGRWEPVLTRAPVHHFTPTRAELTAWLRWVARAGFRCGPRRLKPAESVAVCERTIRAAEEAGRPADLLTLGAAFLAYLDCRDEGGLGAWAEVVGAVTTGRRDGLSGPAAAALARHESAEVERNRAANLAALLPRRADQARAWAWQTGRPEADFKRRLAESRRG